MAERFKQVEAGELSISVARHAHTATLRLSGVLDAAHAAVLGRELAALDGFNRVEVDLNELSVVDSRGIAVLADARQAAATQDREIRILIADGRVRRILELAGISGILEAGH